MRSYLLEEIRYFLIEIMGWNDKNLSFRDECFSEKDMEKKWRKNL